MNKKGFGTTRSSDGRPQTFILKLSSCLQFSGMPLCHFTRLLYCRCSRSHDMSVSVCACKCGWISFPCIFCSFLFRLFGVLCPVLFLPFYWLLVSCFPLPFPHVLFSAFYCLHSLCVAPPSPVHGVADWWATGREERRERKLVSQSDFAPLSCLHLSLWSERQDFWGGGGTDVWVSKLSVVDLIGRVCGV